jgi:YD repeat-containing protein
MKRIFAIICAVHALGGCLNHSLGANMTYAYDPRNRLTGVTYANGSTISYTYDATGNRLAYSGVVTNGGDTVAPGISLTSPTSGVTYATSNGVVTLAGTASDNVGVTKVTWQDDSARFGGLALGTTSWTIPNLPLHAGANYFYLTSHDAAGNRTDTTLTVNYSAPPEFRITAFTISSSGVAQLAGVGPIGSVLTIQTSTNLINWESAGMFTNTTGSFEFPYPVLPSERKRFYRVAEGPQGPVVLQPGPTNGKDIWTTSTYSYASCSSPGPGGGLDNPYLRVGGWGDSYYSLLQFDLSTLPAKATSAVLYLYCYNLSGNGTQLYFDRITGSWDWKTSGSGCDRDRLWWADKPAAVQLFETPLATPALGQWYAVDITTLYNDWKNGTYPNYGVQLRPVSISNNFDEFYSSDYVEDPTLRPKLVVIP